MREGLEHLSPVGVWELFPGGSFRSCYRLCLSGLRIAFLGTISEPASTDMHTTFCGAGAGEGCLVAQAGLNS